MYSFLLIEDNEEDARAFSDTIKRLNDQMGEILYQLDVAKTYEEGIERMSDDFNGIIVDIKLEGSKSGNDIVHEIIEQYRVPVAIFTGTPDTDQKEGISIHIYKKGEASAEDIINDLCTVSDTGLFKILGGKGDIEKVMNDIFWRNLYPQIDIWKEKKERGIETEKLLLRYTVSHIQELVDNEIDTYETEEMYIKPPISLNIKTGNIYQSKKDGMLCIVLSPPCDLALRNGGEFKTDRILVCEIDRNDMIYAKSLKERTKRQAKQKAICDTITNNYMACYHWLPQNILFDGGFINFRKVITYSPEDYFKEFGEPIVKISEYFTKNILNRFSAYYARQGQPDFDFDREAKAIVERFETVNDKAGLDG